LCANLVATGYVIEGDMSPTPLDDTALTLAAQRGDLEAFETLVRAHTPAVFAHAVRFFGDANAAEDVVQEVWIKVYRSLDSFDGRSKFTTWLYRVTRNTCLDQVRQGKRLPVPTESFEPVPAPGDLADAVALSASMESALLQLAPEDRDALSAVSVFDLSYAEAAENLGVPVGTVKSRVFRARRTLSAILMPSGGGE
jgi:RNA polymerase sigma-70 factor (ECF subfamily)